ncbi:hypothetical protein BJ138DRAFT_1127299 [Hygrophoropsis aurantiaca]|uniref:Uncharacterized protein n=1 Tax=Hygrophoropsis aurantiaca TaxID=72124 RepID=A0ACB8AA49_9AGAM|nr:hypothetical protein BJ138DRAFT_1127299 [Hygrophoropsis aurantiaca]
MIHLPYIATIAALFLSNSGITFAQNSSEVCLNSTGYGWAVNALQQDPCIVANDLFAQTPAPCNDNGITFPPIPAMTGPSSYYVGPVNASVANICLCNTVIYSLLSACGLCQNGTFLYWSEWTNSCPAQDILYQQWPASIPSNTAIPPWAYMPLVNGFWDGPQAQNNASGVATQSSTASTSQSSTSASSTASTSAAPAPSVSSEPTQEADAEPKSNAGVIAGGVVGGIVAIGALVVLGIYFWRRPTANPAYQTTPLHEMGDQYHHKAASITYAPGGSQTDGTRPYDPTDPTTFPRSPAPVSELTGTTIAEPVRGKYTGAPEI